MLDHSDSYSNAVDIASGDTNANSLYVNTQIQRNLITRSVCGSTMFLMCLLTLICGALFKILSMILARSCLNVSVFVRSETVNVDRETKHLFNKFM